MSGDTTTPPLAAGFGKGLSQDGEGGAAKKVPAIKPTKKRKRKPTVDTEGPVMEAINEAAGYSAPAVKVVQAPSSPKPPAKPKLPRIGPDPLNWTESSERSQISIPGPEVVFDRFKALRDHMQQPGWVIMNMLLAHWEHNPPEELKQDSA